MDDLLNALLGITPCPPRLVCEFDTTTQFPNVIARRCFGGYTRHVPPEVTVCESLNICRDNTLQTKIEDMTRQAQMRSRLLAVEKRASRYDRAMKSGHK
jgi:hypothetical protein